MNLIKKILRTAHSTAPASRDAWQALRLASRRRVRAKETMADDTNASASCEGRFLYLYDLPSAFTGGGGLRRHSSRSFGTQLGRLPDGRMLYDTHQFALATIVLERWRLHPCLTADASRASLFLVPAWSDAFHHRSTEASVSGNHTVGGLSALFELLERVRVRGADCARGGKRNDEGDGSRHDGAHGDHGVRECSALSRRGGADHVLINPRNGAREESFPLLELNYADPRFGSAARLSVEQAGAWEFRSGYRALPICASLSRVPRSCAWRA